MKQMLSAYCGVDISLRSHKICLLDKDQEVVSRFSISNSLEDFEKFRQQITPDTKICIEPTGVYSINFFLYLKRKNYDIKFCGTYSSKKFREAMFGKKKHDKLDALSLAKYRIVNENLTFDILKLDWLHQDEDGSVSLRIYDLLSQYQKKTRYCGLLKTKLKNLVDLRFPEAIQFYKDRGCKAILKLLVHSKENVLAENFKLNKTVQIKEKIRNTIGQFDCKIKEFNSYFYELQRIEEEMKSIKEYLKKELIEQGYSKLFDYSGLNVIHIATLVSEIKDIKRFYRYNQDGSFNKKRSLKSFKEFVGLAVTSNQSGDHQGGGRMVKFGNKNLKNVLFMLTLFCLHLKPKDSIDLHSKGFNPYKYRLLFDEVIKRKPKMIGIFKVMSKIVTDLFFIFREIEQKSHCKLC